MGEAAVFFQCLFIFTSSNCFPLKMSSHAGNICAQSKCLQSSCCLVFFSWLNLRQTLYFCFLLLPVEESSKSAEVDVWSSDSDVIFLFYFLFFNSHLSSLTHFQNYTVLLIILTNILIIKDHDDHDDGDDDDGDDHDGYCRKTNVHCCLMLPLLPAPCWLL